MKTTDELFQLIRAMDKAEKRHFKIFAGQHTRKGSNHYIKLFDAYDKLPEFDEELLKKRIKDPSILQNLPTTRFRLTQIVLKSLSMLHTSKSVSIDLREQLKQIDLLFRKNLPDLCRRLIKKAKKTALQYEKYLEMLDLINWERQIILKEDAVNLQKKVSQLHEQEQNILSRLSILNQYRNLNQRIFTLQFIKPRARNEEELAPFQAIVDNEIMQKSPGKQGFFPLYFYSNIMGLYHVVKGDHNSAHRYFKANMALWEEYPHLRQEFPNYFLSNLISYLNQCFQSEKFKEFEIAITGFRGLLLEISPDLALQRMRVFEMELVYCMNLRGMEEGERVIQEYQLLEKEHGDKLPVPRKINFTYNITVFYFLYSDFSASLKWLNIILNLEKMDPRQDIRDFARTLQLILHFELGNWDLIEYLFRSTYRYLRRTEELFPLEKAILEFIRKAPDLTHSTDRVEAFKKLEAKINKLGKVKGFRTPTGYQEILFWVESQVKGISLREYFQQKLRER